MLRSLVRPMNLPRALSSLLTFEKVVRSRSMPTALSTRNHVLTQKWRVAAQQSRLQSSLQESNSYNVNEQVTAVLQGNTAGGDKKPTKPSSGRNNNRLQLSRNTSAAQKPHESTHNDRLNMQQPRKGSMNRPQVHNMPLSENQRGKKRKASPQPPQRPARRSRHGEQKKATAVLKDEAYIRSTMHVPTARDYPSMSADLFKSPKSYLHNLVQGLAQISTAFKLLSRDVFQCTLAYDSAVRKEVVEGEGRSKRSAEDAAFLHLLAKCHDLGVLMEVADRGSATNLRNRDSIQKAKQDENDAIVDVYDYAARFDLVPEISTQSIIRKQSGRSRSALEAVIELTEHDIRAVGYGSQPPEAEREAALKFKKAAETFHAKQGNDSLTIKDSTALTSENTGKFVEFLKIVRPGIRIDIQSESHQRLNQAWVTVNGDQTTKKVVMSTKKKAEAVALLIACISLKKENADFWPRYIRALQYGNGQILAPIPPLNMFVDEDCSLVMRETLLGARSRGLPDEVAAPTPMPDISEGRRAAAVRTLDPIQRSQNLSKWLSAYTNDTRFTEMRNKKADLPMNQFRAKVLEQVNSNDYSIIVGATGSGKTTQVPQILLDDMIIKGNGGESNIVCTQPRRIAATSVARRVAAERGERLQQTVGYHVRFDVKLAPRSGSINYCTTGILLQQLQHFPDEIMDSVSHLVIDEVHERDTLIDFLFILLKKNVTRRNLLGKPNPQIVLMSATMDTDLFANYFSSQTAEGKSVKCPSLSVPGRTYPVRERYVEEILEDMNASKGLLNVIQSDQKTREYLDVEKEFSNGGNGAASCNDYTEDRSVIDWKRERKTLSTGDPSAANAKEDALVPFGLVAATVAHIAKTTTKGAILIFLPGLEEIVRVKQDLARPDLGVNLSNPAQYQIYMLHSSITASQQTVFEPVPEGCRKIILSTNIAETSVTIPDVQYVVDTGKLREKQYDQARRITQLACTWISKSNSKQRAGRAGRVQDGNYYALFSKERYTSLRAIGLPELLRTDLQETCLEIKAQAFRTPIRDFLAEAIEPPAPQNVDASVFNLQTLDALTENEDITPLGRLLASLPIHPSLGKMIVLGVIFRCLDPMLVLGAASSERALFINPLEARKQAYRSKLSFVQGSASDHIALLNAVRQLRHWRNLHGEIGMRQLAHQHFLHANAFKTIDSTAQQIETVLVEAGLIPYTAPGSRVESQFGDPALNENSHKVPLVKALTLAGLHPNFAVCPRGGRLFRTPGEKNVLVHPSSTNDVKDDDSGKGYVPHSQRPGVAPGTMYSYTALAKSNDGNSLFMRDTTKSTPLQACLFGGKLHRNEERANIVEIDNWLPFYIASPDRRTAKTLIEFRKGLERLLASTFNELGSLVKERQRGEHRRFLADDVVREMFAAGLVEVLDRDITPGENIRQRGWATTGQVENFRPGGSVQEGPRAVSALR